MPKIVLLGDSTLDNQYWVTPGFSVTEQLQAGCPTLEVLNLAVDGFTTHDVLIGGMRDKAVQSPAHTHILYEPLKALKKVEDCQHIILSVGGNDFRESLGDLIHQTAEERLISVERMSQEILSNYTEIVKQVQKAQPTAKITALFQYTPCSKDDPYNIYFLMSAIAKSQSIHSQSAAYLPLAWHYVRGLSSKDQHHAVESLHEIMANLYHKKLAMFMRRKISVIDMATTFNHSDPTLYVHQIEPSAKGAALMVKLILEVMVDNPNKATLYSKPSQVPEGTSCKRILGKFQSLPWRPGHVYNDLNEAKTALLEAYNADIEIEQASNKPFQRFFTQNAGAAASPEVLLGKSMEALMRDVQSGRSSRAMSHTMKRLGFLDSEGNFTKKSCIAHFEEVSDLVEAPAISGAASSL